MHLLKVPPLALFQDFLLKCYAHWCAHSQGFTWRDRDLEHTCFAGARVLARLGICSTMIQALEDVDGLENVTDAEDTGDDEQGLGAVVQQKAKPEPEISPR